jgi:hypothetical protein
LLTGLTIEDVFEEENSPKQVGELDFSLVMRLEYALTSLTIVVHTKGKYRPLLIDVDKSDTDKERPEKQRVSGGKEQGSC